MKISWTIPVIASILILGFIGLSVDVYAPPAPKVTICHIPPGNSANLHTIEVSENAVDTHIAHGDTLGACGTLESPPEPTIVLTEGGLLCPFTVTDPFGFIEAGDLIIFIESGTLPPVETPADNIMVLGPSTIIGTVPNTLTEGLLYNVEVRSALGDPPKISGLEFLVTVDVCLPTPAQPSIEPTSGPLGTFFTITDPQGRIPSSYIAVFYEEGTDPSSGTIADNITVSVDGTTIIGNVPQNLAEGVQHFVSVRENINDTSLFNDLPFLVTG